MKVLDFKLDDANSWTFRKYVWIDMGNCNYDT